MSKPIDIERFKEWQKCGHEALAAQLAADSINEEDRTLDIVWFTGIDVARYSWVEGSYTLRLDPKGVDLSRLNNGAPLCDNHAMYSVSDQKGVVDNAWVDGSLYKATVRLKRSTDMTGPRPELDGLWQDIKDKIVNKFSMGVEMIEYVDTRNKDGQLELRTATAWRPFELSLAPIPADPNTTSLAAQSRKPVVSDFGWAAAARRREIEILNLR